jgi:hypothetical protein
LLRQSNATPTVSAYAHLSGPFDYNKMPLAPMGCEVQIHEKTDKRGTWAYHCVDGWYLNTSPEHYRVHNCYTKTTRSERLSDTVAFKHKTITNPELTPADKLMHAIAKCREALKGINGKSDQNMKELKQVIEQAETQIQQHDVQRVTRVQDKQSVPRVQNEQALPRVQPNNNNNTTTRMQTRSIPQQYLLQRLTQQETDEGEALSTSHQRSTSHMRHQHIAHDQK